MPDHGGRLNAAAEKYNIAIEHWLDLSTGINPHGWPVPEIPARVFNRLPEDDDGLIAAARKYYAVDDVLPVAGSQAAIQLLPHLRTPCRVAVPDVAYAEHAHAWQQAGHDVFALNNEQIDQQIDQLDVLVLINPNNPTAKVFSREQLLHWHQRLARRNGWLIVDEAFMDASAEHSLLPETGQANLIVLRSLGKFFGLAGIRCGFVMAEKKLLHKLSEKLGPWSLTNPTRFIARQALQDTAWQAQARADLKIESARLKQLLKQSFDLEPQGTVLFQTVFMEQACEIHHQLACQGVLTRLLDNQQGIRFGLPRDEQWQQLEKVLQLIRHQQNDCMTV